MEGADTYSVRDYLYGTNGLISKESLPYESSGASSTASTSISNLYTTYAYDQLDRIIAATTSVGTTKVQRTPWVETIVDPLGNSKDYVYDGLGRLTQVKEYIDSDTYTTAYQWDANNNLTKITDALGNVRNMTYDGLSRRLTFEDLHAVGDGTYGNWTFTYDDAGNLTSKVDPKDQTINYTYDDASRQTTEDYIGNAGTEVTYTYDSCTRGVGRICTLVNSGATTTYAYTYIGLPGTTTRNISGTTYTTKQSYDRQGNQTSIVYPDNSEVRYVYNSQNLPETIEQKESGGSWDFVIEDFDYGPHSLVTYQLHGNGASTTKIYDANEFYRLKNIITTATSTGGAGGPGPELQVLESELFSEENPELEVVSTDVEMVTEEVVVETQPDLEEVTESITEDVVTGTTTEDTVATPTEDTGTTTAPFFESVLTESTTTSLPTLENAVTTPEIATTTLEIVPEVKVDTKTKDKLITSTHEARVWQKFHRERVEGLIKAGAPQETVDAAIKAQGEFEEYLLQKKYTKEKGAEVRSNAKEFFETSFKSILQNIVSFLLPVKAYAYLFGGEDFESCVSIPCSFSSHSTWGSVAGSLDNTSKAVGVDSYKTVVTGEGSASLESVDYNRDEIWAQFKVYVPLSITWGPSAYFSTFRLEDSSNGSIFWLSVENWGNARLTMAGDTLSWTDTGLNLTKGATNTIEVRFKKGTSNGDVDIWLNNSTQGSPDYNGSGTLNTGNDNVDDVFVGMQYAPDNGISTLYYDEIAIDSAFIGTFSSGDAPPVEPFRTKLQDLRYTYDAVGNITQIVDVSLTSTAATTSYQYDDLYRLTTASTTQASSTPYAQTYTYNAIGNLMTKSDVGTYTYGGNQGGSESILALYSDSIAGGYSDWSWSTTLNPSITSPVAVGTYSLRAQYGGAWSGMALHTSSLNSSGYDDLRLRVNMGTSTAPDLYIYFTNASGTALEVLTLEDYVSGGFQTNTWHTVEIPLSDLEFENYNGATTFTIESSLTGTVYFDQIELVDSGGGTPSYANPHAATEINGVSQNYDRNGNLASTTAGLTYTWNYQNRLTQSLGGGTATTTYLYDDSGRRTSKMSNGLTWHYPSILYEAQGATTTKHIYAGDTLVATIQSDTPAPKMYHVHSDHLESTSVVSTPDGYLNQEVSYYPFGSIRIENQYGELNQQNMYIGQDYDEESTFSYLNARYYNGTQGRFVSQDPVFWEITETADGTAVLLNPQAQNSYSYSLNNPITYKDPSGRGAPLALFVAASRISTAVGFGEVLSGTIDVVSNWMYPLAVTPEEQAADQSELLYDATTLYGGSKILDPVESLLFDSINLATDGVRRGAKRTFEIIVTPDDLTYQTTPSGTESLNLSPKKQELISVPKNGSSSSNKGKSSSSKNSNLDQATKYYNTAKAALDRGDLETAEKYGRMADAALNGGK